MLGLWACTSPDGAWESSETTDVASVLRVTWQADDTDESWLRWFGEEGRPHQVEGTPVEPDGFWEALIVASPDEYVTYEMWDDAGLLGTGSALTEAAQLPVEQSSVSGHFNTSTATSLFNEGGWFPVVLGTNGTPRWWFQGEETGLTTLRTRLVDDGVWINAFDAHPGESAPAPPALMHIGWDGTVLETVDAPTNHHDFWVHKDGTLVWIAFEYLGSGRYGDELLMRTPNGETRSLFSLSELGDLINILGERDETLTWANHLSFDGTDYWLSVRNLDLMVQISGNGELIGTIGADGDMGVNDAFAGQHGGEHTDAGLLLHDNNGSDAVRVVEYDLDADSGVAELMWQRQPDPSWQSMALGDAIRIANQGTRISWGLFSTLEELDSDGEVRAEVVFEPTSMMGFLTQAGPLDQ